MSMSDLSLAEIRAAFDGDDYPPEACGCCEINDYAPPDDDAETACETCGHSPEEHLPPVPDATGEIRPIEGLS
jgi:hypothetical protein